MHFNGSLRQALCSDEYPRATEINLSKNEDLNSALQKPTKLKTLIPKSNLIFCPNSLFTKVKYGMCRNLKGQIIYLEMILLA